MPIAVIDANVVVASYLSRHGVPSKILEAWERREFELILSEPILEEYERVLRYPRLRARHGLTDPEVTQSIAWFRQLAPLVQVDRFIQAVEVDPSDDKFVECAVAGGADYIVSGDEHLLALREYAGICVLTPRAFLAVLARG